MSRIAGTYSRRRSTDSGGLVKGMLSALRRRAEWNAQSVGDRAVLGWTGSGLSQIADAQGVQVALDGRIYNRAEFEGGLSQPEIVADLYRRYGFEDALRRLNGDFAIALYDSLTDVMWLGRDRYNNHLT